LHLTTLHGRLDIPDLAPLYREFSEMPVVSISNAQRTPLPWANWLGTVYHGLPPTLYRFHPESGKYLAFVGRISPEKRVDRAIHIARRAGIPLKIAAKIDAVDAVYFKECIEPMLDGPDVEYLGEIGDQEKDELLGGACAMVFPIDWPEPFGLVMIEAMACGTPVIAWRNGSIPEVIDEGITGWVVSDEDAAVRAACNARDIDRRACRNRFLARFTVDRMARDYVALYERILKTGRSTAWAV
jgi:glycosyltransferase involved in cell wall biosynthesis